MEGVEGVIGRQGMWRMVLKSDGFDIYDTLLRLECSLEVYLFDDTDLLI